MIRLSGPRPKPARKFYVCNGQKCQSCPWTKVDDCHHTTDIEFARYDEHPDETFELRIHPDFGPQLWERIRRG